MWPSLIKQKMWKCADLLICSLSWYRLTIFQLGIPLFCIPFTQYSLYSVFPHMVSPIPMRCIPILGIVSIQYSVSWYLLTWEFAPSRGIPIFDFPFTPRSSLALPVLPASISYCFTENDIIEIGTLKLHLLLWSLWFGVHIFYMSYLFQLWSSAYNWSHNQIESTCSFAIQASSVHLWPVSREMLKDGPIIQLPAVAYFYLPLPTNYQLLPAWN